MYCIRLTVHNLNPTSLPFLTLKQSHSTNRYTNRYSSKCTCSRNKMPEEANRSEPVCDPVTFSSGCTNALVQKHRMGRTSGKPSTMYLPKSTRKAPPMDAKRSTNRCAGYVELGVSDNQQNCGSLQQPRRAGVIALLLCSFVCLFWSLKAVKHPLE